jgi:hypothetical protein
LEKSGHQRGSEALKISSFNGAIWSSESEQLAQKFCTFITALLWSNVEPLDDVIVAEVDAFFLAHNICSVKSLKSAREHMARIDWRLVRSQLSRCISLHDDTVAPEHDLLAFCNGLRYMALGWIEEKITLHSHGEMLLKEFFKKAYDYAKYTV